MVARRKRPTVLLTRVSPPSVKVDRFRRCDLCAPGMVLSRGACILRADFVHIDMDGESDDTAVGAGAYP